jgi:hypothetical protein
MEPKTAANQAPIAPLRPMRRVSSALDLTRPYVNKYDA